MKKIRINELARELEVKAHEVLERLPELGVTEKKTHSSSIDEDVAIKLRRLYGQDVPDLVPEPEEHEAHADAEAPDEEVMEAPVAQPVRGPTPHFEPSTVSAQAQEPRTAAEEKPSEPPRSGPTPLHGAMPVAPIRPPLVGGRPIHPPIGAPRREMQRP